MCWCDPFKTEKQNNNMKKKKYDKKPCFQNKPIPHENLSEIVAYSSIISYSLDIYCVTCHQVKDSWENDWDSCNVNLGQVSGMSKLVIWSDFNCNPDPN